MVDNVPITEAEIEFMEMYHDPTAMTECLIPDKDAPFHNWPNCACVVTRDYQFAMQNYSYMFADDPLLSEYDNIKIKKGAGDLYSIGSRNSGKSFYTKIDIILSYIHAIGQACLASFDFKHLNKIASEIADHIEGHKFLKIFFVKDSRQNTVKRKEGIEVVTEHGFQLKSVNEKAGTDEAGIGFWGLHYNTFWYEEGSEMSKEGTEKRVDAGNLLGYIERISGIPNFCSGSPLTKIFNNKKYKNWIWRLPQFVMQSWNDEIQQQRIEEYNGENCFDAETEVLTNNGWKNINTILETDKVLSLDYNTQVADYYLIKNIFKYNYNGKLNYYDGLKINFAITDKHKIPYRTYKKQQTRVNTLDELRNKEIKFENNIYNQIVDNCLVCGQKLDIKKKQKRFCSHKCSQSFYSKRSFDKNIEKFYIPSNFIFKGETPKDFVFESISPNAKKIKINNRDWAEFLGWFLSEGWISNAKRVDKFGRIYYSNEIAISQTKKKYLNEISDLLKRMGFSGNYNFSSKAFLFNSKAIVEHLKKYCYEGEFIRKKTKYNCFTKKVPSYVKNWTPDFINIFLNAFNKGDGDGKRTTYYTTSVMLKDGLQELIFKVGNFSIVRKDKKQDRFLFIISEDKNKTLGQRCFLKKILQKEYNGKIWCLEVEPFHNFFIRRKGRCHFTGNSAAYKLNVLAEIMEGAFGLIDMDRFQVASCKNVNRKIKQFEIGKDDFNEFDSRIIVERLPGTQLVFIDADVGYGAAPTEIVIHFFDGTKYKYYYNISLYRLLIKEQAKIFKFLYDQLGGAYISADSTCGNGELIDELAGLGIPQDHLLKVKFTENIDVGFEKDSEGNQLFDEQNNPIMKQVGTEEWSFKEMERMFYNGEMEIPQDDKLMLQVTNIIAKNSKGKMFYDNKGVNHLVQAMQCFFINRFFNEFKIMRNQTQRKRSFGVVNIRRD